MACATPSPGSTGRFEILARLARPAAPFEPRDEVERRLGPTLSESGKDRRAAGLMRQVRRAVGDEPCLVYTGPEVLELGDAGFLYAGYVYFLADLVPGPILLERTDMVADSEQLAAFLGHFEEHAEEFGAVVSSVPRSEEIRLFRKAHPGARVRRIAKSGGELFVVRVWPGQESGAAAGH